MRPGHRFDVAGAFFGSAHFITALTLAIVGAAVGAFALRQTIGWPGFLGILSGLVVFSAFSLLAKRHEIEWSGLLPISLLTFVGWAGLTVFWSQYQWTTLGGLAYLAAFTVLGITVALLRDTIQIVRAFGDVLRVTLGVSLGVEIIAGLLLDTPIHFLGVTARLDTLGPIEGILGTRNQLGLVALVALITFGVELRTKSVHRGVGIGSLVGAALCLALSRSPVSAGALLLVSVGAAALYGLRRAHPEHKRFWQFALLAAAVVAAVVAWTFRVRVIDALAATGELNYRMNLWRGVWDLIPLHQLEGWGWVGAWHPELPPFVQFDTSFGSRVPASALNAYLDVWLQLGLVGFVLFAGLVGLTLVRSWLLASRQRSVVFVWPALVLLALVVGSLAESSILVEFGWLTLVICSVKAARELSWRQAFAAMTPENSDRHPLAD